MQVGHAMPVVAVVLLTLLVSTNDWASQSPDQEACVGARTHSARLALRIFAPPPFLSSSVICTISQRSTLDWL